MHMAFEREVRGFSGWGFLILLFAVLFGGSYALVQAARELQDPGTHGFWANAIRSMGAVKAAFRAD